MEAGWRRTKNAEIISQWDKPFPGFNTSPSEFYSSIETAFAAHEIPEVEVKRVIWREGSFISANREYLRIGRKRHVCDICAAPFGKGFFFSFWGVLLPPSLSIFHWIGMVTTAFFFYFVFTTYWGYLKGSLYLLSILAAVWLIVRSGGTGNHAEVEEYLLGLTIIGAIRDAFYRDPTYFEIDTANMFQKLVHSVVMEAIDDLTDKKGLPRLTENERKPLFRDFFRRR